MTHTAAHTKTSQGVPTKSSARPRLGFLGAGWIGRHRLEAITRTGICDICLIAEPVAELAAQAGEVANQVANEVAMASGKLSGQVALVSSLDELLERELDGIVIATPSALHAEQSIRALERGLAVFCQKPLGRNADETRRVIEAARANNLLLAVDLSYRFITGMSEIRALVQAGELGKIFAVNLVFHNAYGPNKKWFYDKQLSGGGCVIDLGIHLVDLALWTLGFPNVANVTSRLFAGGEPLGEDEMRVEDYAVARLDLENGTIVQLACSWNLNAGCEAVISADFYGTRGGARLRNLNGSFYDFTCERFAGTTSETITAPDETSWEWGGRAAVDWATRLAAGEGFNREVEHLIDIAEVLDRIYAQ